MTLNKKAIHRDPTFPCPPLVRQRGDWYPREFLDLQERRDVHGGLQQGLVGGDDFGALDVALELLHVPLELGAPVLEPRDHLRGAKGRVCVRPGAYEEMWMYHYHCLLSGWLLLLISQWRDGDDCNS